MDMNFQQNDGYGLASDSMPSIIFYAMHAHTMIDFALFSRTTIASDDRHQLQLHMA